jgi:hypothetical protein
VWKGVEIAGSNNTSVPFYVDRPGAVQVTLPIYNEIVVVRDIYGLPVRGAMVTITTDGQVQTISTNSSGIALFPQLPPGPIEGTVKYLTFSANFSSPSDSQHVVYATATLSYPVLVTILTITALAAYVTIRSVRRKTKSGGYVYYFR